MPRGKQLLLAFLFATPFCALFASSDYVDPVNCRSCHARIYEEYEETPMGRSFYRPDPNDVQADWEVNNTYYHALSDRHYEMRREAGKFFIRRYQLDKKGRQVNVLEKQVTHIMGSGEMVRIYMNQTPDGRLFELPVAWYGQENRWGMPPGYGQPRHYGFTRTANHKCMFCHNGYPEVAPGDDRNRWGDDVRFTGWIPMGIDCQRCHGPGKAHIEAIQSGDLEKVRASVVNPAKLSNERRLEVCMQCHMETTTFFLPESYRRFGRPIYSYRPGEPLADYIVHFDHPPGAGYDDKFTIGSSAYRLRKSACFTQSDGALTCTTCHNPHKRPRPEEHESHYRAKCFSCHSPEDRTAHDMEEGQFMKADCVHCHMPRRRSEDAVHVVVTDHMIQRIRPDRDLTAPRREYTHEEQLYRGRVDLYFPKDLNETERDLYLGVAHVKDSADLERGVEMLQRGLKSGEIQHPEPYYELAEALVKLGRKQEALRGYRRALELDPSFIQAHNNLGLLLADVGETDAAIEHYRRALTINSYAAQVHNNLGVALLSKGQTQAAEEAFRKAIQANSMFPFGYLNLGKVLFTQDQIGEAKKNFEQALAIDPSLAEAHNNLGLILLGLGLRDEAAEHLEYALREGPAGVQESARKALSMIPPADSH